MSTSQPEAPGHAQPEAPGGGRGQAVAALDVLARLADGTVTGVMLVLRGGGAAPDVCQIRPTQRVLPELNQVVRAAAGGYADSEIIDYGPAVTVGDGQVMWVSLANVPLLRAIVAESADLAGMPLFDPGRSPLGHLQLAALRAASGDAAAVFLQPLRGNQIVARSSRFGVIVRRGVLDVPSSGEILLFNRGVAAIVVGGTVLFRDRRAFERLFGYLEELQRQAAATFRSVTSQLRIDGLEQMAAAATGSAAMLGKMASIQRKLDQFPQYRAALTMPNLLAFVRKHPEYEVDTAGSGDDARLVYRGDAQHRFKILKLLDDDYLHSELTSLGYEANSKTITL